MKKLGIALVMGLMILVNFSGCAKVKTVASDKLSVVSTIFAPYDFAKQIAGDQADVTMLVPPGTESHAYEPTPQDIIKIQEADVFIYVGSESDTWVDKILGSIDTRQMKIIALSDIIQTVEEEIVEGMQEDEHEHEEGEHQMDEHVWTSPKNAKLIVQELSETISELDAGNSELYLSNTESYLTELDKLDSDFQAVVNKGNRKTLVFGDRFPFRYFADAYGLNYYAAFSGCSTETEASATTIAFLIDKVKEEKIPVVFHVELSNGKIAKTVSEETGAKVLEFHACHNVTKDEVEEGVTYLELMNKNLTNLQEALS